MDTLDPHIVALSMIKDVGPVLGKYLIAYCGSAKAVFQASLKELVRIPNINESRARKIKEGGAYEKAEQQMEFCKENNILITHFLDDSYPRRLKNFEQAPIILYYKGSGDLNYPRTIGIVGTRKPTEQGKIICQQIVEGLKEYDVQIISGLAHGIDSVAHKSALEHNLETIALQGHGHDIIYPAMNRSLAQKMCTHGGLLSEFPIQSRIDREHFPMRNRLIAMQSDAVIVVESAKKGGSMITATFANEFNKDVFAVPGRVNDEASKGCNLLIKSNRAHLLESASDIAYIMGWTKEDTVGRQASLFLELSDTEQSTLDLIKSHPNINIDDLQFKLQLSHSNLAAILVGLEFQGVIRSLPGKK